jgi:serine carboxypeptidase-like clade I
MTLLLLSNWQFILFVKCVKDIFPFHILEPKCAYASPHPFNLLKLKLDSDIRLRDAASPGLYCQRVLLV